MSPRLSGQTVSLGLIGGGSLTDAVRDVTRREPDSVGGRVWSQSKDWIAGAMLEFRIRPAFSVEVDGMYRELHMTWASVLRDGTLNSVSPSPVVTWEFPVLARYRFHCTGVKPFVEAGPSFRTTGNLNFTPSHLGASAGLGVEARWRGMNIAPRLRYTRWAPYPGSDGSGGSSQLNQLEMLVAFSREAESMRHPGGTRVSLGAVAGWGLNADLPPYTSPPFEYLGITTTQDNTGVTSLIAGPSVEIHLLRRLSVEVDALHKPLRTRADYRFDNGRPPESRTWTEAATWQFPVLAKYRFRWGKVEPFAEAGPSFRLPQWDLSTHGVTAGAGVRMRAGALNISPALRFTRWGPEGRSGWSGVARNEAAVLVGFALGGGLR